jgi:hypothetical protein
MSQYDPKFDIPFHLRPRDPEVYIDGASFDRSHGACGCPPGTRAYHLKECFLRASARKASEEENAAIYKRLLEVKTKYDQPPPLKNEHPPVWLGVIDDVANLDCKDEGLVEMVLDDINERMEVGVARYGTTLQPFNGRDSVADAYSEALDLLVYLKQSVIETGKDGPDNYYLSRIYEGHLKTVLAIRRAIEWAF